jgi:outer membrane protein assembly factor BamB
MRKKLAASLAAALCAAWVGGALRPAGAEDASSESDPGKEALDALVATLPFKDVKYFDLRNETISRVTLLSDALYVEARPNKLFAVDRLSGVVRWVFETDTNEPLDFPPVIAHGLPEERAKLEEDLVKVRIRLDDEKKAKNPDTTKLRQLLIKSREIQETHRVLAERDNLYCLSKSWLFCLDRLGGQVFWKKDVTRMPLPIIPSATPFATRAHVFIPDLRLDRVYPIEIARQDSYMHFQCGDECVSQPVYEDPSVYFTSKDGSIYSYNVNGKLNWKHKTLGPIVASPAIGKRKWTEGEGKTQREIVERTCYVGSTDMGFYAFDADGGNLRWKYETGGVIETPAVAVGNSVYVKTQYGALLSLSVKPLHKDDQGKVLGERRDGELRWRIPLAERFIVKTPSRVYVLGQSRQLFGVEETSGTIKSRHDVSLFPYIMTNAVDGTLYLIHPAGHFYVCRESKTEF